MAKKKTSHQRASRKPVSKKRSSVARSRRAASSGALADVLLIILIPGRAELAGAVAGLLDLGLSATVLEAKGLATVLREDVPIFGSLAEMLPVLEGSRVILSATSRPLANEAMRFITDEVGQGTVAMTVPIERLIVTRRG
ncbi:MAG TPA: hypothetical protein VG797_04195 [Phycisphaerales bacterium]|nr:hypothetical protein [Phycisphaerales bacterium]